MCSNVIAGVITFRFRFRVRLEVALDLHLDLGLFMWNFLFINHLLKPPDTPDKFSWDQ